MTDVLAVALAVTLVCLLGSRAVDDLERPKVVLVQAEWSCRRAHPELDASPVQDAAGTVGRVFTPIMVCDAWSRR